MAGSCGEHTPDEQGFVLAQTALLSVQASDKGDGCDWSLDEPATCLERNTDKHGLLTDARHHTKIEVGSRPGRPCCLPLPTFAYARASCQECAPEALQAPLQLPRLPPRASAREAYRLVTSSHHIRHTARLSGRHEPDRLLRSAICAPEAYIVDRDFWTPLPHHPCCLHCSSRLHTSPRATAY